MITKKRHKRAEKQNSVQALEKGSNMEVALGFCIPKTDEEN